MPLVTLNVWFEPEVIAGSGSNEFVFPKMTSVEIGATDMNDATARFALGAALRFDDLAGKIAEVVRGEA